MLTFFWKQREGWWERGGVSLLVWIMKTLYTQNCCKTCWIQWFLIFSQTWKLQSYLLAFFLSLARHLYIHWELCIYWVPLVMDSILLNAFFFTWQFHQHYSINRENISRSTELRWLPVELNSYLSFASDLYSPLLLRKAIMNASCMLYIISNRDGAI